MSYFGTINLTKLQELARQGHSSFRKSPHNGQIYCTIEVFEKEHTDQYGYDAAVSIVPTKEAKEKGQERAYIGNLKKNKSMPISKDDVWDIDLPASNQPTPPFTNGASPVPTEDDKTPF